MIVISQRRFGLLLFLLIVGEVARTHLLHGLHLPFEVIADVFQVLLELLFGEGDAHLDVFDRFFVVAADQRLNRRHFSVDGLDHTGAVFFRNFTCRCIDHFLYHLQ